MLHCEHFESDSALRAVFVDARISQWAADLPEANSKGERVRVILKYLADKRNTQGENALVLFLHVLYEPLAPIDALRQELAALAAELEQYAPTPDTTQWDAALDRYREWVKHTYGTMHVLGKPEPVSVEGIYTDVYLLDKPQAMEHFDPSRLTRDRRGLEARSKRQDSLGVVRQPENQHLVILGKPGAGKTTFLKHIALQAVEGKLGDTVPVFVALREWTATDLNLMDFINEELALCGIAHAPSLAERLLDTGRAILLFDGLDEVNEAEGRRAELITALERFFKRYTTIRALITCRTAATEYQFVQFKYVEVADFTDEQVTAYVTNWFQGQSDKHKRLLTEFQGDERLSELARMPLLLGMLCLTYEELGRFPKRHADLYREALDVLLMQWDESRKIKRDARRGAEIYRDLSLGRKHQLFTHIAYATFVEGEILISQKRLETLIEDYLITVPNAPERVDIDARAVLKAIETQHGILVERGHRIYSFAHLTFQEYFSACYVTSHTRQGVLLGLLNHCTDDYWREVIRITASLLDTADAFFEYFLKALDKLVLDDSKLVNFFNWITHKTTAVDIPYKPAATRAFYIWLALDLFHTHRNTGSILDRAFVLAKELPIALGFDHFYILELKKTPDLALDLALDRVLSGALALDSSMALMTLPPEFERALASLPSLDNDFDPDIDRVLADEFARTNDPGVAHSLDFIRMMTRVRDMANDLANRKANVSTIASINAEKLTDTLACAQELGFQDLYTILSSLTPPSEDASRQAVQTYITQIQAIMIEHRDIGHDWDFSEEQVMRLGNYLRAVYLLVECLDVANISVTDRAVIEDRLLLPPMQDEGDLIIDTQRKEC